MTSALRASAKVPLLTINNNKFRAKMVGRESWEGRLFSSEGFPAYDERDESYRSRPPGGSYHSQKPGGTGHHHGIAEHPPYHYTEPELIAPEIYI